MMSKIKGILILLTSLIFLSGCQSNVKEDKISQLEEENQRITSLYNVATKQLETVYRDDEKLISVSYIGYEEQYRFIENSAPVLWMPDEDSPVVCRLKNKLVNVLFAGYTSDDDIWLFVSFRTYDAPTNNRGWIRETDTVKYTKEIQKLVTDIIILKGTMDVDKNPAHVEDYDQYGMIEKREDDKVLIMFAGGKEAWYYEKDIVYPPLE